MPMIVGRQSLRALKALAACMFGIGGAPAFAQTIDPNHRIETRPRSEWRASVGMNYSMGFYGESARTGVLSFPLAIKYARGPLTVRGSLPLLRIRGPADILGVEQIPANTAEKASAKAVLPRDLRSGPGDARLSAIYSFDLGRNWYVDAAARVRLPTGSTSKGLGTGRVDAEFGADLVKEAGDASFYAGARRTFAGIGSSVGGRNRWGASAGASYWFNDSLNAGVDYDWEQSSFAGDKPTSESTIWTGFRVAKRVRARVFVTRGLNGDSADFAGGLSLSWRLN